MNKKKIIFYAILLAVGLLTFILEIFVFQKPDGVLGLIICLLSIYLTVGALVKLCRMSEWFKGRFFELLDLLFWLP